MLRLRRSGRVVGRWGPPKLSLLFPILADKWHTAKMVLPKSVCRVLFAKKFAMCIWPFAVCLWNTAKSCYPIVKESISKFLSTSCKYQNQGSSFSLRLRTQVSVRRCAMHGRMQWDGEMRMQCPSGTKEESII